MISLIIAAIFFALVTVSNQTGHTNFFPSHTEGIRQYKALMGAEETEIRALDNNYNLRCTFGVNKNSSPVSKMWHKVKRGWPRSTLKHVMNCSHSETTRAKIKMKSFRDRNNFAYTVVSTESQARIKARLSNRYFPIRTFKLTIKYPTKKPSADAGYQRISKSRSVIYEEEDGCEIEPVADLYCQNGSGGLSTAWTCFRVIGMDEEDIIEILQTKLNEYRISISNLSSEIVVDDADLLAAIYPILYAFQIK